MKKAERQRLIKQLIMQQEIETQDELITRLEELGVRATQATVSRDIREMSIVKTHGADGRVKYAIFSQAQGTSSEEKLRESVKIQLFEWSEYNLLSSCIQRWEMPMW